MSKYYSALFTITNLVLLTACDRLAHNAGTLGQNIETGYDKTRYKLSDYLYSREAASPMPPEANQLAQTAYCYKLQTDIVCYDQPVARLNRQLVSAQNTSGATYETTEAPKDSAIHEPAPVDSVTVGAAPAVAANDVGTPKPLMSGF